jgi:hypothetical protein
MGGGGGGGPTELTASGGGGAMGRRAQGGDERAVPRRAKKTLTMTRDRVCTWPAARAAARAVRVEAAHGWSNAACRPVPSWKPGLPLPARSVISPLGATRRTVCEPESVMKVTPSLVLTIPWGSTSAEMLPRPSRMPGSPLPTIVLTAP